jgi:hypothetical protein
MRNTTAIFISILIIAAFGLVGAIDLRAERTRECYNVIGKMANISEPEKSKLIVECINQ